MLRIITDLREKDPALWGEVERRIHEIPDHINFYCRFTYGELVKAQGFRDTYGMSWTPEQYDMFMSRFNECETNLLNQLSTTTMEERLTRIESRVKVSTQRTTRFIESLVEEVQHEQEIERLIAEKQSKRIKTKSSMESDWMRLQGIF